MSFIIRSRTEFNLVAYLRAIVCILMMLQFFFKGNSAVQVVLCVKLFIQIQRWMDGGISLEHQFVYMVEIVAHSGQI